MLSFIIVVMLLISVAAGCLNGSWEDISASAVSACTDAVELGVFLGGSMALWCGLMRVAERSGLTAKLSAALSPVVRLLFGRLDDDSRKAVSLNLTANLLGLGNAATPTGIAAVKALGKSPRPKRNTALLTVLNTASIQLIPVTIAALRAENGSAAPFEILPAVLVTSLSAAAVGCVTAAILFSGVDKDARN
ncbi:nucleoside recognition domain-containing protein [Ruminococcus sp.]|uniref:nucleoside recognition domain-containing protein n=1 Tax=Ruminococcus sp. TaxID=41978 RepID=UPI001B16B039|nr:nucleoside recognition domain-containing protein [Ruminococcus sp.]MBO5558795.1 spore maturation protein A [Ruminococcus sp.]